MPGTPCVGVVIDHAQPSGRTSSSPDPPDHDSSGNPWWRYVTEVLDHVRLPYRTLASAEVAAPPAEIRVLVFPTRPQVSEGAVAAVESLVHEGGVVLTVGDPGPLRDLVGVTPAGAIDDGHVRVHADAPDDVWTAVPEVDLHAVGGVWFRASGDVSVWASWVSPTDFTQEPAVTMRRSGAGAAIAVGPDVWQSIVRIQQGYPVTQDGVPATDGTAPIDDGILKCEDGLALSFERDRAMPPGHPEPAGAFEHVNAPPAPAPVFHQPQADLWRGLVLQCVWWAAERAEAPIGWLFYWPAGTPAVAHMSQDADGNNDEDARAGLDAFAEADVRVTWCQLFPGGYSPKTFAEIGEAGHEHALHFNARHEADIAEWGWPQMRAQYAWAQAVTGCEGIVSNKNHYTRWEEWAQFYTWCERLGIEIDQSRGPSKHGTIGFPFGTAHLTVPMADASEDHRYFDVLNLPLHTQDLAWAAHESVRDVILDGALGVHGVAHFLFHGTHLNRRPATRQACLELAAEARRRGLTWWTSAELNRWERVRRGVQLAVTAGSAGWRVDTSAVQPMPGAAILLALPGMRTDTSPRLVAGEGELEVVTRHGRRFVQLAADIPAGSGTWVVTT